MCFAVSRHPVDTRMVHVASSPGAAGEASNHLVAACLKWFTAQDPVQVLQVSQLHKILAKRQRVLW